MNLVKVYEDKMPQYFFSPKMNSTKPLRIEISLWVSFTLFCAKCDSILFSEKEKNPLHWKNDKKISILWKYHSEQSPNNNSNTNLLEDINFGRVPVESNAATTIYRH